MAVCMTPEKHRGIHGMLPITVVTAVVFPGNKNGGDGEEITKAPVQRTWATGSGHVSF